jgi:hypothetical protein
LIRLARPSRKKLKVYMRFKVRVVDGYMGVQNCYIKKADKEN